MYVLSPFPSRIVGTPLPACHKTGEGLARISTEQRRESASVLSLLGRWGRLDPGVLTPPRRRFVYRVLCFCWIPRCLWVSVWCVFHPIVYNGLVTIRVLGVGSVVFLVMYIMGVAR